MGILEEIVLYKKKEVAKAKVERPLSTLENDELFERITFSLSQAFKQKKVPIIAEHKRHSPSKGWIQEETKPLDIATNYVLGGAAGVSMLTDKHFFKAKSDDLSSVRSIATPILRKDFIIDSYQVFESKAMGADVILLIGSILTKEQVREFAQLAEDLGMESIYEIHNEAELDKIDEAVTFVGVNNRNLSTFEESTEKSIELIHQIPSSFLKISESSLRQPHQLTDLLAAGFDGFLVGEYLMKQSNPMISLQSLIKETLALQA